MLEREKAIPPLDFDAWITDVYARKAYEELGLDYDAETARMVDPVEANAGLPMEIWHARDGISTYPDHASFLQALAEMRATGAKINASYVYDVETGLKLFGKTAFWVKSPEGFATFLRKREAEAHAAETGGEVIDLDAAVASFAT